MAVSSGGGGRSSAHGDGAGLGSAEAPDVLGALDGFPFDRPCPDRKPLRAAAEVITAFPEVRVAIDSKEQRANRPTGYDAQKQDYFGKKRAYTVKTRYNPNENTPIQVSNRLADSAGWGVRNRHAKEVLAVLAAGIAGPTERPEVGQSSMWQRICPAGLKTYQRGGDAAASPVWARRR